MPPGARNSFSTTDVDLLVKYLAELSENERRKGNRAYQRLTENATGQWPWSTRHTWQSWRHRYMRNEGDMERRIRVYKRRQAKAAGNSQEPSGDTTEEEEPEPNALRTLKRKVTPVAESRTQVKRLKKEEVHSSLLANNGFVRVSQLVRRRPAVAGDKGEGPSRIAGPSTMQPKPQPIINKPKTPTILQKPKASPRPQKKVAPEEQIMVYPNLPASDDYSGQQFEAKVDLKTPTIPQKPHASPHRSQKKVVPEEQIMIHPDLPASDDYSGQLFEGGSDAEMQLDPEAGQEDDNDDMEVNHILTDPVEPDSDKTNAYASTFFPHTLILIPSTFYSTHSYLTPRSKKQPTAGTSTSDRNRVPRGSSDGMTTTADSGFFESTTPPPPFPRHITNPSNNIFDGFSDTDSPPRPLKARPVPKLIEGPFGGARHKHPVRRIVFSSPESDSIKTPVKGAWPPVRGTKRKLPITPEVNITAPLSSSKSGHVPSSSRPSGSSKFSPPLPSTRSPLIQLSRKGKEHQLVAEDENQPSGSNPRVSEQSARQDDELQEEEEKEPLFTQRIPSRDADSHEDEEEEPLFIQRIPSREADDYEEEEEEPLFTQRIPSREADNYEEEEEEPLFTQRIPSREADNYEEEEEEPLFTQRIPSREADNYEEEEEELLFTQRNPSRKADTQEGDEEEEPLFTQRIPYREADTQEGDEEEEPLFTQRIPYREADSHEEEEEEPLFTQRIPSRKADSQEEEEEEEPLFTQRIPSRKADTQEEEEEEEPLLTQKMPREGESDSQEEEGDRSEEEREGKYLKIDDTDIAISQNQEVSHTDDEEPLFTQIPPRSPSCEVTTEPAFFSPPPRASHASHPPRSSHASHVYPILHPFDIPELQYHTPNRLLRTIHPFDMPDIQHPQSHPSVPLAIGTPQSNRSDDIARPSVSNETAESVVRALNAFILEMDRSRKTIERDRLTRAERAKKEAERMATQDLTSSEQSLNGAGVAVSEISREKVKESVVRARGSPVPMGAKKQQVDRRRSDSVVLPHDHPFLDGRTPDAHSYNDSSAKKNLGKLAANEFPVQIARPSAQSEPTASGSGLKLAIRNADIDPNVVRDSANSHSSSFRDPGQSTSRNKGKNRVIEEIEVKSSNHRDSTPSTASTVRSKQIDLRQLERAQSRRRSSLPTAGRNTSGPVSGFSASSPAAPTISITPTTGRPFLSASFSNSRRVAHSPPPHSPLKLSSSDQSRLIDQTIQDMAEEYQFPPDYVRRVWKQTGDLNEAAAILRKLRDMAGTLLRKASARRSSGFGAASDNERSRGVPPESIPATDINTYSRDRFRSPNRFHHPDSSRFRIGGIPRKRIRSSFGNRREVFLPKMLDGPLPEVGYSPPTHSRAGQIALLSQQGRAKEAIERDQRRATGRGEVFVVHPLD
ncbi:uncharacterized protein C8R40DRAFT_1238333 [Lentinula edodes]|uniref:uncharacterized protein n=1 Tax=Lentinula edodes TaxID=5353 RepID=UPI001E8D42F6|nr:uncharacterized protein C8R40DRAFT_1238333 [Lentinula edodes]KAH7873555.1 hypothetical protein C8R40DRAFT_1238333 [Lentinula edodes]